MTIDTNLFRYATPGEERILAAILEHEGVRPAARALDMPHSTVRTALRRVEATAAIRGYAPLQGLNNPLPAPFIMSGASTLVDESTGQRRLTWYKSKVDPEAYQEQLRAAAESFFEGTAPVAVAPAAPLNYQSDIIPWIQIGDAHLGMLAHAAETGENFDLKIGEAELCAATGLLIDELPPCDRLVINDLGDFTHYETFSAVTEASGHALDFDNRYPRMIKTYSRVMRYIIDKALTKAKVVDVIINQGNHSRSNDVWMAELLRVAYGPSGRVNVLNNDSVFIGYRMGNTLVMIHHSDKARPARLCNVMTSDFREDFGETMYHYIDIGHVHHNMVLKEHPSILIESFNNLAPADKWAHDNGYRSRRSITTILRSRKYGEVGRRLLPIEEVYDRIRATAFGGEMKLQPARRAFTA